MVLRNVKKWQHAPRIYSFMIMTVCVSSDNVGKSPIPAPCPAAAHCVATRLSNTNVFWRHSGEVAARRSQPDISPAAPLTHSILDISIRMYLFVFWQLEPDQIQYIHRKVAAVCRAAGYVVTLVHNSTANLSGTSSFTSIDQIRVDDD